jgi:prepilin-type N-terminal cleavage/methylation domain-containing protein
MLERLKNREKGFTLIEIVLVLAIAGLILLIVFLALSGAQKARRDTQRKNDASGFVSALEQYASNNTGAYPPATTPASPLAATYWSRMDPSTGVAYLFTTTPATVPPYGTIAYNVDYVCSGGVGTTTGAKPNNYAVVVGLEQGGSACYSNQ